MKYAFLPAIALAAVLCFGCDQTKPATSTSSSLELSPAPAPDPTPAPIAYAQPVTTSTPDASQSGVTSASAAASNSYTIQPGDTLWKIAASHYGNGHKWQQIADANPGLEASHLRVGQTITLP